MWKYAVTGLFILFNSFIIVTQIDLQDIIYNTFFYKGNNNSNIIQIKSLRQQRLKRNAPFRNIEEITKMSKELNTYSYMILHNNSVISEHYFKSYIDDSKLESFSITKSIVSLMVGIALDKKYLSSIEDKIGKYFPECTMSNTSIKNLLEMSSGVKLYSLSGFFTSLVDFYSSNLTKRAFSRKPVFESGKYWVYDNINTQLIVLVLEKATKMKINVFVENYLWKYISTTEAQWSTDDSGNVKAFCGLQMTSEDLLRIGKLIMDKGKVNGYQVVSESYLQMIFNVNTNLCILSDIKQHNKNYGLHAWKSKINDTTIKYFFGSGGQFLLLIEEWNTVVVHMGFDVLISGPDDIDHILQKVVEVTHKTLLD
ncbi:hypothetical protein EIN_377910 [Entamoeba invadens IP1]|uniref:Beta-lactamase-related domain-containing protein n=1 Tax=Entamoeba invadens IP1 TaxID=370355 RepID=A0A0A1TYE1_ENTIV|nr:hypothetical protein EIN_377910 [Entamoeba invadens IP1]ELP83516.1 hypothetical protein EIN_377910 [Entamoeba invadens IP1]|eukprot:XP_004182862.1 hypothetical protein EIN_377910 [Entamoeba invadens IP1]